MRVVARTVTGGRGALVPPTSDSVSGRPIRLAPVAEPAALAGVSLVTGCVSEAAHPIEPSSPDPVRHHARWAPKAIYRRLHESFTGAYIRGWKRSKGSLPLHKPREVADIFLARKNDHRWQGVQRPGG